MVEKLDYEFKINHNKPKDFYYLFSSPFGKSFLIFKTHFQFDGVQQCLKLTEKMQEHLAVLQDMKTHLNKQQPISSSLEILKAELEQLEVSKVFFMLVLQ